MRAEGASADLDFSVKPEPAGQQSPATSAKMPLPPADDQSVKDIGAGMQPYVNHPANKPAETTKQESQKNLDAEIDEDLVAATKQTKKNFAQTVQSGKKGGHGSDAERSR